MATPAHRVSRFRFAVFTADPQTGELRKQGIPVKLQERPFQLLVALLERSGEVVTREELRRRLWPDGTFVDFDHSISSAINKLRGVLNDSATHPRYIETVGRRGYRFLADVKQVPVSENETAVEEPREENQRVDARGKRRFMLRPLPIVLGIALLGAALLAGYLQWRRSPPKPSVATGRVMLAVLPFDNLTGDAAQEYFSDGLTEEMITQLGQLNPEHLGVIARTSAMRYKDSSKSIDQIGRELGVQYVVEGSVRRDSNNVRISAQLIQVKDQTHLWAREYDRELKSVLVLQGEIAQEVADEIQLSLGNQASAATRVSAPPPATSYEAYDLYLKGRYFWNKRTPAGFQQAAGYFQQAIDKDPKYARAYAGLADTFGLMTTWGVVPPSQFMPKARAAALKALELDDTLAEAHTSLALIVENYDYDWPTAEREFQRALQLNPAYATAHQWYAEYLGWQGRFDEALQEGDRARQLDPMSVIIASDHAYVMYYSRQYDRAIAECRGVADMDPRLASHVAWVCVGSYVQEKKFVEALDLLRGLDDEPFLWASRAYVYGRWGRLKEAQHALARFEQLAPALGFNQTAASLTPYAGGFQKTRLIALLEKAYAEHSPVLTNLKVDPKYDPLRSDPRFQDLLRRLNLRQ